MGETAQPNLPLEIIERIVKDFNDIDDNAGRSPNRRLAITTLAQVSVVFSCICRPYIWRRLSFGMSGRHRRDRLLQLVEIFQETPMLTNLVRNLDIDVGLSECPHDDSWLNFFISKGDLAQIECMLSSIPNLLTLSICGNGSKSRYALVDEESFCCNVLQSLFLKGTLERVDIYIYPTSLPTAAILSCPSLRTLGITFAPTQWADLTHSHISNLTYLVISTTYYTDFDLRILDHCPRLRVLELMKTWMLAASFPTTPALLPSFNLERLWVHVVSVADNTLAVLVDYYCSRARSIGVEPFQNMETLGVTIMSVDNLAPIQEILKQAKLLKSLTIEIDPEVSYTIPVPSSLNLGELIRHTHQSLTWLTLTLFADPNTQKTVLDDIVSLFTTISGYNILQYLNLEMHLRFLWALPQTLKDDLIPLDRLLASRNGYPELKEVEIGFAVFRGQSWSVQGDDDAENAILRGLLDESMLRLREREEVEFKLWSVL
ncbi:hypothetical protein BJ165DRAFT_1535365 [Panaeolus papilionaceus]|nr:hypothetical protein BJ165DRAFT_1535365 [Panaeolus papilionaceus]